MQNVWFGRNKNTTNVKKQLISCLCRSLQATESARWIQKVSRGGIVESSGLFVVQNLEALKVVISKKRVLFSLQTEQILWWRRNPEPSAANVHGCHHLKPKLCRNRLVETQRQQLDSNQTVTPEKRVLPCWKGLVSCNTRPYH